jgi:hypothetical protein
MVSWFVLYGEFLMALEGDFSLSNKATNEFALVGHLKGTLSEKCMARICDIRK